MSGFPRYFTNGSVLWTAKSESDVTIFKDGYEAESICVLNNLIDSKPECLEITAEAANEILKGRKG